MGRYGCGGASHERGSVYLPAERRQSDKESADGVGGWTGGDSDSSGVGASGNSGASGSRWPGLWADRFGRGIDTLCEPGFSGGD